MIKSFKKKAFTLAEVLIVIGIIGIIANMTIPTLVKETTAQQRISMLQKTYSEMSQAFTTAVNENGPITDWGIDHGVYAQFMSKYLKMIQICNETAGQGCFAKGVMYRTLDGGDDAVYDNTIDGNSNCRLADGAAVNFHIVFPACDRVAGTSPSLSAVCGYIMTDVNGDKGPNMQGHDYFFFWINKNGVITPMGTEFDLNDPLSTCATTGQAPGAAGMGCAAWVIYQGNMKYLTCQGSDCDAIHW